MKEHSLARKLASIPYVLDVQPIEPMQSKLLRGPLLMKVINNDYLLKKYKK